MSYLLPFNPKSLRVFIGIYFFFIICLFFYSFTQVDLGLTMTRVGIFTDIQKAFQYVGYFNRPLSTLIYLVILIGLFVSYGVFIYSVKKKLLKVRTIWKIIMISTVIMALSYSAFSYDIFNYIFDAKIFTHYQLNPYEHKALDFPADPMLAFMHWTHRTYPYGPLWLGVTVPLSYLGLNIFLPTFFLFKALAAFAYLGTTLAIAKIMRKVSPEHEGLAVVFFALNPLVIIESLVSGHNDIVMMCLCMFGIYFFIIQKYTYSYALLIGSAALKFATGILLPLMVFMHLAKRKKVPLVWPQIFLIFLAAMTLAMIAATLRTATFQPWYLLLMLPIAALLAEKREIVIASFLLSIVALLNYVPYLYFGNWDGLIPGTLHITNVATLIVSLVFVGRKGFGGK